MTAFLRPSYFSVAYGHAYQSDLSNVDSNNNPNASASNQNAFGAAMLK